MNGLGDGSITRAAYCWRQLRGQCRQYTHQRLHEHAQAVLAPDQSRLANAHRWCLKVHKCGGENHESSAGIVDAVVLLLVEDVAARF